MRKTFALVAAAAISASWSAHAQAPQPKPTLVNVERDADGKITIYLQHESPGKDREANWLPIPAGPYWATLRLYRPKPEALEAVGNSRHSNA